MAILSPRNVDIGQIFEFATGSPAFDFVDIVNDAEQKDDRGFVQKRGTFVYKTALVVNDRAAALLAVDGLRFEILDSNPERFAPNSRSVLQTFEIPFETATTENIKVSGNTARETITARVPRESTLRVFAAKSKKVRLDSVSVPNTAVRASNPLKVVSRQVDADGLDPAALAAIGNFATQTAESSTSLDARSAKPRAIVGQSVGLAPRTSSSLRALRSENTSAKRGAQNNPIVRVNDTPSRSSTQSSTAAFELLPLRRLVNYNVNIDKDLLRGVSRFYVRVTAIKRRVQRDRPLETSQTVVEVDHRRYLAEFLANPLPPKIEIVAARFSSISFRLSKIDPTLDRVTVTRIVTNPYAVRPDVQTVANLEFGNNDVINFSDSVSNVKPNKITYRVSAVNADNSLGEFSSIVVPSFTKVTDPQNSAATPLSIFATNRDVNGVQIFVNTLTEKVHSLRLLRQEIGKTGNFSDSVVNITNENGAYETVVSGKKAEFRFIDSTAVLGRKYRYFVAYRIGPLGFAGLSEETISDEDEVIIRRYPYERLPFNVDVRNVTVQNDDTGLPAVTFDTSATESVELFNAVLSSLREAGVGEEFITQLQADKVKAKNFVMLLVERYEVETGRNVSFGLRAVGDFVDDRLSRARQNIPDPVPGFTYRYSFKVCLQDPTVFLQSTDAALVSRLGVEINKKASRFGRKIFTRLGVLPAESDVKNGVSIEQLVLEAQVGIEIVETVKIPIALPTIDDLSVDERSFFTMINWRTNGDLRNVSYFVVFCSLNGETNLLGAVAASPENEFYRFRDDRYNDAVGTKSYSVQAISFEHDVYIKSPVKKSTKSFSVPDNMMVGAVFGSFGSKRKVIPIAANGSSHRIVDGVKPPPPSDGFDELPALSDLSDALNPAPTLTALATAPPVFSNKAVLDSIASLNNFSPNFGAESVAKLPQTTLSITKFVSPVNDLPLAAVSPAMTNLFGLKKINFAAAGGFFDTGNEATPSQSTVKKTAKPKQTDSTDNGYGNSSATKVFGAISGFMF